MKERPILFSGPMVRAILDGSKTQTRRVVKPQPPSSAPSRIACDWYEPIVVRRGMHEPGDSVFGFANDEDGWRCPYGAPGDRLWCRETFGIVPRPPSDSSRCRIGPDGKGITWRADWNGNPSGFKWKPSIHMPRWASRITLEVTGVRVERLNEINAVEAMCEGIPERHLGPIDAFAELWESINGAGSWDENPWVWVVEFKRLEASDV